MHPDWQPPKDTLVEFEELLREFEEKRKRQYTFLMGFLVALIVAIVITLLVGRLL